MIPTDAPTIFALFAPLLEESPGGIPTSIIAAAGAALAGAVVFLFKLIVDLFKKDAERAEEVGLLRGRQDGIESLARDTLDVVHRAAKGSKEELAALADEAKEKLDTVNKPKPPRK